MRHFVCLDFFQCFIKHAIFGWDLRLTKKLFEDICCKTQQHERAKQLLSVTYCVTTFCGQTYQLSTAKLLGGFFSVF